MGTQTQTIEVYGRLRPCKKPSKLYSLDNEDSALSIHIPKSLQSGFVNNQKENFYFPFAKVFDTHTTQDQIFDQAAAKVVDNVLAGYNGTIFAYGQTGSGKTFTITGGPERYEDRGIIPRSIDRIFKHIDAEQAGASFNVRVSYLEIYNGTGYDLLDPGHDTKRLEDLPRVQLREDDKGNTRLTNISSLPASSIDDALNLLFVGDTNRMICETPMNDASSRSHCVFMLSIESRSAGSGKIRRSKLNLVDLAGSERVFKTRVDGKILDEARYINLSLHSLAQVIVALHEKAQGKRNHIPYRNSMIASVLKDSLGGNCKTMMIATASVEERSLDETISTCRFAQRVAMIVNNASVNEEEDPKEVIRNLRLQIKDLRLELEAARGENTSTEPLGDDDLRRCQQLAAQFMRTGDIDILPTHDPQRVLQCFLEIRNAGSASATCQPSGEEPEVDHAGSEGYARTSVDRRPSYDETTSQIHKLQLMIQSRDNEIRILVSMLKKQNAGEQVPNAEDKSRKSLPAVNTALLNNGIRAEVKPHEQQSAAETEHREAQFKSAIQRSGVSLSPEETENLAERNKAFEEFRRSYRKNQAIEDNRRILKDRYAQAKALGAEVNNYRSRINVLKADIEKHRLGRSVQSLSSGEQGNDPIQPDEEELRLVECMDREKRMYKRTCADLKEMKSEIEHVQHIFASCQRRLQKDFAQWWDGTQKRQPSQNRELPAGNQRKAQEHESSRTPPKTGDALADADIAEFFRLKEKVLGPT